MPIRPRNAPDKRYVSKTDVLKHLWSGAELDGGDKEFVFRKYAVLDEIRQCIIDFREIYNKKDAKLMESFIKIYSESRIKPIASFASGLSGDMHAVMNSVVSGLSNGFVEGTNNKIKLIKRMMYGRAKIDLLRVKVLFAK